MSLIFTLQSAWPGVKAVSLSNDVVFTVVFVLYDPSLRYKLLQQTVRSVTGWIITVQKDLHHQQLDTTQWKFIEQGRRSLQSCKPHCTGRRLKVHTFIWRESCMKPTTEMKWTCLRDDTKVFYLEKITQSDNLKLPGDTNQDRAGCFHWSGFSTHVSAKGQVLLICKHS